MRHMLAACIGLTLVVSGCGKTVDADVHEATVVIQNHRFEPAELKVPAGRRIKLNVVNQDASAEEFESHALDREKIVAGNGRIAVVVGPLKPGRYPYFGEFHMDTAKGALVAE